PAPHERAPDVPKDLEAVCCKAMAKDPGARYQRAAHLAEDLRCFLDGRPPRHARRAGPAERALAWVRRNRTVSVLAAVPLRALGLAGLTLLGKGKAPEKGKAPDPVPPVPVVIPPDPPEAEVTCFPLDEKTGLPQPERGIRARGGEVVDL